MTTDREPVVIPEGYTPGDWEAVPEVFTTDDGRKTIWLWIMSGDTKRVCRVVLYDGLEDEMRANAKLLRLAPRMAEEIVRLREALERFAVHGIPNIDHIPTRMVDPSNALHMASEEWWQAYFAKANEYTKAAARAALGDQ